MQVFLQETHVLHRNQLNCAGIGRELYPIVLVHQRVGVWLYQYYLFNQLSVQFKVRKEVKDEVGNEESIYNTCRLTRILILLPIWIIHIFFVNFNASCMILDNANSACFKRALYLWHPVRPF